MGSRRGRIGNRGSKGVPSLKTIPIGIVVFVVPHGVAKRVVGLKKGRWNDNLQGGLLCARADELAIRPREPKLSLAHPLCLAVSACRSRNYFWRRRGRGATIQDSLSVLGHPILLAKKKL